MTAPESRPDIESTLADAFRRRHAGQAAAHPSLVDVRRRAHRRSARSAVARTGAVVAAGAAVVAGGWAVTRDDSSPAATPGGPVTEQRQLGSAAGGWESVTLSVDGLWSAVAAQLGTTAQQLRAANPAVDFTEPPVPGMSVQVPGGAAQDVTESTVTWPAVTPTVTVVDSTVTIPGGPAVATTVTVPPPDWREYVIVAGDYLHGIAQRFCTTADVLVAANAWTGDDVPLWPDQVIVVPADAC